MGRFPATGRSARSVPPGRGLFRDGRPEGSISGHDDGVQPTRGGPDGDSLRVDRPRRPPLSRSGTRFVTRGGREGAEHESGLTALGGLDDELGFGVYTYRIAAAVAEMAMALGGLDVLAFSAVSARTGTTSELRSPSGSRSCEFRVEVVPAREELVIADEVRACLELEPAGVEPGAARAADAARAREARRSHACSSAWAGSRRSTRRRCTSVSGRGWRASSARRSRARSSAGASSRAR